MNTDTFETPAMVYTHADTGTVFVYKGGYIDVGHTTEEGEFVAYDLTNVYEDVSQAFTVEGFFHWFQSTCAEYLGQYIDTEEEEN